MMSNQTQIVEFSVCSEIEDWFKKHINDTFGSDIQLRYLSNDDHFDMQTQVEISASGNKINEVVEFIGNTSELLQYKLLWLNGNPYYIIQSEMDLVQNKLKTIMKDTDYMITSYHKTGCRLEVFTFRPDLDVIEKKKIENFFKTLPKSSSLFITFPKVREARSQTSFSHTAINVLRGYHGKYLQYLELADILSLEVANNGQDSGPDGHLNHDVQMHLRNNYPYLYDRITYQHKDLKDFKINEVLRYFIHKYQNCFKKISISNILTVDEIQSLSQAYNIQIVSFNLIHIDFKSANVPESVDFCAIYHFDPHMQYFVNYNSKYASENHVMNFKADNSLEPLKCSSESSYLVLKSLNNCSPQKSNSTLKCMTEHFATHQNIRKIFILYEFDLNHVSTQILSSVVKMMGNGKLEFHKMSFNYKTIKRILELTAENTIGFLKCHIVNIEVNPISSKKSKLAFYDMDIDLNLLCSFNNLDYLEVMNCRLLSKSCDVPIITGIFNKIVIHHTNYDVTTFIRLLYGLQCVPFVILVSCELTPGDLVERRNFILRNKIEFINMIFHIRTLFQMFENCEVGNRMYFKNCHFLFEPIDSYKFRLKPVKIQFNDIKFDSPILLAILESLNGESYVLLLDSFVFSLDNYFTSTKIIKARYVHFKQCILDTNSLLNILVKVSKQTLIILECCDLVRSSAVDQNILTNLSDMYIQFWNMTIESQIARPILQTNSEIIFQNCCLTFMTDELSDISIQSTVSFVNMTFDAPAQLNSLARFTPSSSFMFANCKFIINFEISKMIQPFFIIFKNLQFDFEVRKIMTMISENTVVFIDGCVIQAIGPELDIPSIKIRQIHLLNMSLQIETILCFLNSFTNPIEVGIKDCKIVCKNSDGLPNIKLKPSAIYFKDMKIDVQVLQTLVLKCTKNLMVSITDCEIKSSRVLSNLSVDISFLRFKNVNYTPDVLRLFQCLNDDCYVAYLDHLSNQAIIEICTKSSVNGDRLSLPDQSCSKSFYFELFAESFRAEALNFELDQNTEYDLPTYLIPCFQTDAKFNQFDWDEFKIKFVEVNDGTVKIEFLKNGKVIDLFFELNDLPDDSDESVVDYY